MNTASKLNIPVFSLVLFFCFLQTEHKMSIEEICRKLNTDIVQVRVFVYL